MTILITARNCYSIVRRSHIFDAVLVRLQFGSFIDLNMPFYAAHRTASWAIRMVYDLVILEYMLLYDVALKRKCGR